MINVSEDSHFGKKKKILVILSPVYGIEVKCLSQKLWTYFYEDKKEGEAHSADERESFVRQVE